MRQARGRYAYFTYLTYILTLHTYLTRRIFVSFWEACLKGLGIRCLEYFFRTLDSLEYFFYTLVPDLGPFFVGAGTGNFLWGTTKSWARF